GADRRPPCVPGRAAVPVGDRLDGQPAAEELLGPAGRSATSRARQGARSQGGGEQPGRSPQTVRRRTPGARRQAEGDGEEARRGEQQPAPGPRGEARRVGAGEPEDPLGDGSEAGTVARGSEKGGGEGTPQRQPAGGEPP